jgi:hypothetical protein
MKRTFFVLATLLIITSGYAQVNEKSERQFYKQGDWEFSFSSNIGSSSVQTTGPHSWTLANTPHYSDYYEDTENWIYLSLGVSAGFYIIKGLSIEPEFDINSYADGWSVTILGNLCYTFNLPQNNIYPYVKVGYGLSNEPTNSDYDSNGLFEDLNLKTINAGVGLKFMYYPRIEFKTEINYRSLTGSKTFYQGTPDSYSTQTATSIISVLIGISILL